MKFICVIWRKKEGRLVACSRSNKTSSTDMSGREKRLLRPHLSHYYQRKPIILLCGFAEQHIFAGLSRADNCAEREAEEKKMILQHYLDSVVGLLVENGDIFPAHAADDIDHGLHLIVIAGDGASEELKTLLVAQLRTRWEKWHLKQRNDARFNNNNKKGWSAVTRRNEIATLIIFLSTRLRWRRERVPFRKLSWLLLCCVNVYVRCVQTRSAFQKKYRRGSGATSFNVTQGWAESSMPLCCTFGLADQRPKYF